MNLLHVSAHYGGGVGTVMNAWKDNDELNHHVFTHLNDIPMNTGQLFDVGMISEKYDVVICHVWNHPSMFEFLVNTTLPPCRMIIWSHISGLRAPDVYSTRLIEYPDKFVFTTPISYQCKEIMGLPDGLKGKLDEIWSTYDISRYKLAQRVPHDGFNVGFTGTANYGKLHHKFIEMCANVKSPVKFIVCSHDSQEHLKFEAQKIGAYDRFEFKGKVPDVAEHLVGCDVFGYPLQPSHFGSCEQAIGEAMACGTVPVVLGSPTERYIVTHMETGIVAENEREYSEAIDFLYKNRDELKRMSYNARVDAARRYDVKAIVRKWNFTIENVMKEEKRARSWSHTKAPPYLVYTTSLGIYGEPFIRYVFADCIGNNKSKDEAIDLIKALYATNSSFFSESKGGVKQYLRYYQRDRYIQEWAKLLTIGG